MDGRVHPGCFETLNCILAASHGGGGLHPRRPMCISIRHVSPPSHPEFHGHLEIPR